ncbi:hypothetical protein [Brevibacillus porteri]|uniref:hypothetical protein n=1 Tax=Brevibacillus porteri TaxID=2126350 RepID=UPI00363D8BD8
MLWDAQETFDKLIERHGFDCKAVKDDRFYKPMAYRLESNAVHYNVAQVLGVAGRYGLLLKDTFLCIAYHELGHYLEIKQNPALIVLFKEAKSAGNLTFNKFKYEREKAAYTLGRDLITDERLLEIYDALNKDRLESSRKKTR